MIIKVIFDDNTNGMIDSHMLQFGTEFGLNGNNIKCSAATLKILGVQRIMIC